MGYNITSQPLPIFSEETFTPTPLLNFKNFQYVVAELLIDSFEDTYEGIKPLSHIFLLNYKNTLLSLSRSVRPLSYATIFDMYRADYNSDMFFSTITNPYTGNIHSNNNIYASGNPSRLINSIALRSTVKNSIVTYNALQKVFRSRLDEGRAHLRLFDFTNSYVPHPYITDGRYSYESLVGKNNESFYRVYLYNQNMVKNINYLTPILNASNIYNTDLPFLISFKSDPTRYLWFD
jgi:hypothetical protein